MERLTVPAKKLDNGRTVMPIIDGRAVREHAMEFYWRLKEYEDLEEQGKLIKLPCRVGDSVYRPLLCLDDVVRVEEIIVSNIGVRIGVEEGEEIRHEVETAYIVGSVAGTNIGQDANFSDFGKTIFLTKAEAEKALAEITGE